MTRSRWIDLLICILSGLIMGLTLSLLDGRGDWLAGWLIYGSFSALACIALLLVWRKAGSPKWLAWLIFIAFLLRLALGVTFTKVLPSVGYDTEVQKAGYIASDAYSRDIQSWELASSQRPIMDAFDKSYAIDQYGGLEALSAFVYRYFSPDLHRPWLMILLGAWFSSLSIVLLWRASLLLWDDKLASLAAWIFAFYPEGIWLGSSQLREPFLTAFIIFAFYGLFSLRKGSGNKSLPWLLVGLVGLLLFSPGVAIFLIVLLGGWLLLDSRNIRIPWKTIGIGLGIIIVALILFWVAQSRGSLEGYSLWETLSNWFRYSVKWDIYQLERDSGIIQRIFSTVLPESLKVPFIFIYGLLQPVLPASIFDAANGFWQIVGILRSLGWYLLLPLLIFSFSGSWKSARLSKNYTWLWLFLVSWIWIFISSLRAGGDQWDNPRYRAIFLVFQALLAAKSWLDYRQSRSPWFKRILMVELVFVLIFSLWYAARYTPILTPMSFSVMVIVIVICSLVILIGGSLLDRYRKKQ